LEFHALHLLDQGEAKYEYIAFSLIINLRLSLWLQLWIQLAKAKVVETKLSRKIIHTGSGPLFMLLWPLYSSTDSTSKFIAAAVPIIQTARLLYSASKKNLPDQTNERKAYNLADSISRSGFTCFSVTRMVQFLRALFYAIRK
jgi:hypothetical protein